jgi:ComF family protein
LAAARPAPDPAGIRAALTFAGVGRDLIVALKFRHRRSAATVLAAQMVRRLRLDASGGFDVITWAPTSARRARRRGYDQAELIARAIARQLRVPCRRFLYRSHGSAQTGKTRVQRLAGPAFRARRARPGLRVLVVDDVVTTGATLRAAGRALVAAGVDHVQLVAAVCAELRGSPPSVPRSLPRPPVGCAPAWESSIASSAPVKARS